MVDLKRISFPDFNILIIHFDSKKKILEITIEGAWLENNLRVKALENGLLKFKAWNQFEIRKFALNGQWVNLSNREFEPLKDICFEVFAS